MLVSLRELAGMSLGIENLQTGTPAATRNLASVTVDCHGAGDRNRKK